MIEVSDLRVRYPGRERDALAGVSFTAPAATLTALVGPNGSGKSTFVRALLGRVPASGDIRLGGTSVRHMPSRERARHLAVVVQREEPAFPITVGTYVALGRHPWRSAWTAAAQADVDVVDRALRDADAWALAGRFTHTLSGGEWQRVRLARALAQDTPRLVLDEPTAFLDMAHEMAAFERCAALAQNGRTVLVISHQLNLVARFASQVVLLSQGQVVAAGAPDGVMRGDVLERVYGWPLVVSRDPAVGAPTLVPLRRPVDTLGSPG